MFYLLLHMSIMRVWAPLGAHGVQKRTLVLLELELWMVVNSHVGASN